jgi:hypothetical protein
MSYCKNKRFTFCPFVSVKEECSVEKLELTAKERSTTY